MKYLKYFETEAGYASYKNGSDYVTPNVSYVEETKGVNYNPHVEPKETRLVCTYNITDTTRETYVCNNNSSFTSMEVDGVLLDSLTTEYTFDTVGEHTVKFELADPTTIGDIAFNNRIELTSIIIPDSVTTIGSFVFCNCPSLTSVHVGLGVTSIGEWAFSLCTSLNEITCLAPTAPTIDSVFNNVKEGGVLKVPAESDYSSWMNQLNEHNWTIEYI